MYILYIYGMVACVILLILWMVSIYKELSRLKSLSDKAWSEIEAQLKHRYDLISEVMLAVQDHKIPEEELLDRIAKWRFLSQEAVDLNEKAYAEGGLSQSLKTLFAVTARYQQLKANQDFLSIQEELARIEHEVKLSRRYYNGAARNYNITLEQFPANIVAFLTGFQPTSYFEIIDVKEEQSPNLKI